MNAKQMIQEVMEGAKPSSLLMEDGLTDHIKTWIWNRRGVECTVSYKRTPKGPLAIIHVDEKLDGPALMRLSQELDATVFKGGRMSFQVWDYNDKKGPVMYVSA